MKLKPVFSIVPVAMAISAVVAATALAETSATVPMGYMKTALAPSPDGTTRAFTAVCFPLDGTPVYAGSVASIQGSTVDLNNATLGDVTTAAHLLHVRSATNGGATGRSFLITAKVDGDSVTVDATGLTLSSLLAANDQVSIFPAKTLGSVFGGDDASVKLQKAESAYDSDVIYLFEQGAWKMYFFYTGYGWIRDDDPLAEIRNDTIIYPDEGAFVARISTGALPDDYAMQTGYVPSNARKGTFSSPGFSFLANQLPTAITLAESGLAESPSWQTAESAYDADVVYLFEQGAWKMYFLYTGYGWVRDDDPNYDIQDDHEIPAGAPFFIQKRGAVTPLNAYVNTALNYSLN